MAAAVDGPADEDWWVARTRLAAEGTRRAAGKGDAGGENEEKLRIASLDAFQSVWIMAWDYGKVQEGSAARFKDSDVSLVVMDDKGKEVQGGP